MLFDAGRRREREAYAFRCMVEGYEAVDTGWAKIAYGPAPESHPDGGNTCDDDFGWWLLQCITPGTFMQVPVTYLHEEKRESMKLLGEIIRRMDRQR
jgi:hypothetical protein